MTLNFDDDCVRKNPQISPKWIRNVNESSILEMNKEREENRITCARVSERAL